MSDELSHELEPAFRQSLPAPHTLVGMMRESLHRLVTDLREQRGDVAAREDVYVPVRRLAALQEGLTTYASVFRTIASETLDFVEDELVEAVGEQEGVPLSGMAVPDEDGTRIRINLDAPSEYLFDLDAILNGVVAHALATHPIADTMIGDVAEPLRDQFSADLALLLIDVLHRLLETGRFEPQVTKVRALADQISRTDPKMASTITSTIKKRTEYRGVRIKRESPK